MQTPSTPNAIQKTAIAFRRAVTACLWCLLCLNIHVAHADDYLGPSEVIQLVSHQLAEGGGLMHAELEKLGFVTEIENLQRFTGNSLQSFSPQSVIENFYQRAEASKNGDGLRLLAILLNEQVKSSAALASDPAIKPILAKFSKEQLDVQKHGFKLAAYKPFEPGVPRPPLPKIVQRGISSLTTIYADQGLSELRLFTLHTFKKEGYDKAAFDKVVLENPSEPDKALLKLLEIGTPQPTVEKAIHSLLGQTLERSAALSADASLHQIMVELSSELSPEQRQYLKAEEQLESRKRQLAEASAAKGLGKVPPSDHNELISSIKPLAPKAIVATTQDTRAPLKPGELFAANDAHDLKNSASYENYIKDTFAPLSDVAPVEPSNPGSPPPAKPSKPTPRLYTKARVSARAGRGVSVGGNVDIKIEQDPIHAVWLTNAEDSRFGRLFVTLKESPTTTLVAASRILFADSFYSAYSVMSTPQTSASAFRQGDILVLMSMSVNGELASNRTAFSNEVMMRPDFFESALNELNDSDQKKLDEAAKRIMSTTYPKPSFDTLLKALMENDETKKILYKGMQLAVHRAIKEDPAQRKLSTQRDIVIHPALFGRELAWSATRVDFWSNQLQQLEQESMIENGGTPFPANLKSIDTKKSSTWQYYEKDSTLLLRPSTGTSFQLVVTSAPEDTSGTGERSHFKVAMFNHEPGPRGLRAEDNLYQRPDIEEAFQPLLDWLSTNHHDYIRLNDFSEAFSLLRWLDTKGTDLEIIDIGPKAKPLITPNRTDIAKGPLVGGK
ncbi:MAG: hypothetical protein ACN6QE_19780 [Pseudomonas putida]